MLIASFAVLRKKYSEELFVGAQETVTDEEGEFLITVVEEYLTWPDRVSVDGWTLVVDDSVHRIEVPIDLEQLNFDIDQEYLVVAHDNPFRGNRWCLGSTSHFYTGEQVKISGGNLLPNVDIPAGVYEESAGEDCKERVETYDCLRLRFSKSVTSDNESRFSTSIEIPESWWGCYYVTAPDWVTQESRFFGFSVSDVRATVREQSGQVTIQ